MATHQTSAGKHIKPAETKKEIPPAAKPAVEEVAPAIEPIVTQEALATEAPAAEAKSGFAASVKFDSAEWATKSFEIWSEHATAVLDLAEKIARAKTLDEVVSLQSRFATERLDCFLRQSKDAAAFAQSVFALSTTPFSPARAG